MATIMWEGDVKLSGIIGLTALLTGLVVSGATLAQEVERPSNYGEKPIAPARVTGDYTADYQVLQPLSDKPGKRNFGEYGEVYYVPSTPETILWGYLPNRNSKPVLTVPSGSTIVFDTVSHEGIQEDQGRNPVNFFGQYGIPEQYVLQDAKAIAASSLEHDFVKAGPHVVTGPLEIEGAQPGDVLMVETLDLKPRVPYGVVSNRHGKGALAGEFPETEISDPKASAEQWELYRNVSIFTPIRKVHNQWYGIMNNRKSEEVWFPVFPFLGIMGIAPNRTEPVHSVPPDAHGGNLDVAELGIGSTLYLPIQVPGALFYVGDPHNSQGDGEVALTALEQSQRAVLRLTLLKAGDPRIPSKDALTKPFGETEDYWIPIGLHEDLDEAMKDAVRQAVNFMSEKLNMDRATALAYMSAASDYEVSQVVDRTKGIHALIRKDDFAETSAIRIAPPTAEEAEPEVD
jgi:acetamidase/formamidase